MSSVSVWKAFFISEGRKFLYMKKKKITVPDILKMKRDGVKIPALTAYGASIAALLDRAGVPIILVGDSVGMVEAGQETTLEVTVEDIIYHTRSVRRVSGQSLVVADMPFMSYQVSVEEAVINAGRLVKEGHAAAVKVEGGRRTATVIRAITGIDIPVMGHIGLTPQSVHRMGGYKVQGKSGAEAEILMEDALAVEESGAFAVVLECIPVTLARSITERLSIPTIGIGAGPHTDGQVLVINDMLGMASAKDAPKFVRRYADLETTILTAVERYTRDVIQGKFPTEEESYK